MSSLSTTICNIKLENPTILASGILGTAGSSLKRVAAKGGAGAVVTKSTSINAREGHKNPSVIPLDDSLLNAIGMSNPGYEAFKDEILVARKGGAPVIGSVFGSTAEEFAEVAAALESYGVSAIELNLSCPNVEGAQYAKSPELSSMVVRAVKERVKIPVIAKLTAEVGSIKEIAGACASAGCDGITAINTLKAMQIDIKARAPVLGNKVGGLSGSAIKPVAVRCVYEIASEVDVPVIGCGGILTGEDAVEFLMAGASAVQIGTGVYSRGIRIFKKVSNEIEAFMEEEGYSAIRDLIGAAL